MGQGLVTHEPLHRDTFTKMVGKKSSAASVHTKRLHYKI